MSGYNLKPTPTFRKDLQKLDIKTHERILKVLEKLEENPFIGKKLKSVKVGCWRIRVGEYRIRYDIMGNDIVLHRVRHRKTIYEK